MRRLHGLVIRLYPRRWRQRYESEVLGLLGASKPDLRDLVDLAVWGIRSRLASRPSLRFGGTLAMIDRSAAYADRLALVGMLVLLPTLTLIVLSVLKYVVGIPGPFDAVEPTVTPFVTHPIGETAVTMAPYFALLLALVPTTRVDIRWRESRLTGSIAFSAPFASLLVAAASASVAVFMGIYWVAENL